ncbi:hypothetical protein [Streptomyces sp. NPDC005209]|uniref:hypothetical protein n=1 Tax=Streptomyces sp. NPDC005209 TaxID=3156715 RepID=UPI0033B73BBF
MRSDGPAADSAATKETRGDRIIAHCGFVVVVMVSAALARFTAHLAGFITAASFGALFVGAWAVMLKRGLSPRSAARRAYLYAFTWTNWL